jgi:hypothetical protein
MTPSLTAGASWVPTDEAGSTGCHPTRLTFTLLHVVAVVVTYSMQ